MQFFELISELEAYAVSKGYFFISGGEAYHNALSDQNVFADYEKIMLVDFPNARPTMVNGRITNTRYSGAILLGQKREAATMSSLDETFQQKYDRRLKDLGQILGIDIGAFTCAQELTPESISMAMEINQLDLNVDFVMAEVTFLHGIA